MTLAQLAAALGARPRTRFQQPDFAESAVLALLTLAGDELADARLTFILRHAELRTHAGQIAFPGGRREPSDRELADTALRETTEELGVPRERVEVIGYLDDVPTPSGFVITPVIGVARPPLDMRVEAREVAEVFDVSVAELRAPGVYHTEGGVVFHDVRYELHEYHVAGRRIWGATARIVHQLLALDPVS